MRFLRHTTLGRTPLDEWSLRRRELFLKTHNTNRFETAIPKTSGRRPKPWPRGHGDWLTSASLSIIGPGVVTGLTSLHLILRTDTISLTLTCYLLLDSIQRHELQLNMHRIWDQGRNPYPKVISKFHRQWRSTENRATYELTLDYFTMNKQLVQIPGCWQVLTPTYFPMYFVWWWEYFVWSSLVIYTNSTNIPPVMILNRIYEHQNLLSL